MPTYVDIRRTIEEAPVLFACKEPVMTREILESDHKVIFILAGELCTLPYAVQQIKEAGKLAFVHVDLVEGLAPRPEAVRYIRQATQADGIISTHPKLLKKAKDLGMFTILRIFLLDSMAYENLERNISKCKPDMVEVLPGIVYSAFPKIQDCCACPLIAGGLIREPEEVLEAFRHGATAISSSTIELGQINRCLRENR